jgi:lipid kinase YegS
VRLFLVMHGKAASDARFREAVQAVREEGHAVTVRVTWEGGDARALAAEGAAAVAAGRVDAIIAVGGDGTVNEVLAGALDAGPFPPQGALGVLPAGTANDFARSIGFDPAAPADTLYAIVSRRPAPIDVGTCVADGRKVRPFLNVATGGYGSQVTAMTDPLLKRLLGSIAYLVTGISRAAEIKPIPARITAEGFAWEGAFATVAIGNGRQAGGGFVLCPEARLDDGLLDLAILPGDAVSGWGDALLSYGTEILEEIGRRMIRVRGERFRIESADGAEIALNLDGEPETARVFEFGLLPRAVRYHVGETDLVAR